MFYNLKSNVRTFLVEFVSTQNNIFLMLNLSFYNIYSDTFPSY